MTGQDQRDDIVGGTKCDCKNNKQNYSIDERDNAWEKLDSKPNDVFIEQDAFSPFAGGAYDVGENYPRGV